MDRTPEGRSVREGCPRMVVQHRRGRARGADPHRRRRRLVSCRPMDTHVFDLTVVDVVEETADAHSVSFGVPEGAEAEFDYKPGPVPDPRRAERPGRAWRRGPLLLAVLVAARRRAAHRDGEAHRRRLRLELDLRQPPRGRHHQGAAAVRDLHAGLAGRRPAAVRRRQRHHPGHVDHPDRARARQRPDRAVLRQPRRDVGDLRQGARRPGGRAPRPAGGHPLAGVGAGAAHPGADEVVHRAVHRPTTRSSAARRRS